MPYRLRLVWPSPHLTTTVRYAGRVAALRTERWARTASALAIFLCIYGSWRVIHWGPSSAQSWIGDVFFLPAGGAAIWAVWRAAQRTEAAPRRARAWGLLGLAVLSYLLGEIAYLAFDLAGVSPYPSPADGFYLGFYPLFFAGLLSFLPQMRNRREHVRFWLDMSVVALGGTAALLYLVLGPAHAAHGKSALATAFSIAYPVGDMILLVGLAAVIVRGSESPMRRPLYLLGIGVALFVLGDVIYQYQMLHHGYRVGDPVDIVWMLAISSFTLSGAMQEELDEPELAVTGDAQITWIPYATVAFGFAVLLYSQRHAEFFPGVLMPLVAFAIAGVVALRQILSYRDLIETQGELLRRALYDDLTGLPNRTLLYDRLTQALARRVRTGEGVAVLLTDLDDFKLVNDSLGHHAGDELLIEVTGRLREQLRTCETVARLGGDEFCVVAEQVETEQEAARIAERIASVFSTPFVLDGTLWHLGASVGIALTNGHPSAPSDMLRDADTAMYRAKANGKGGVGLFDATLRDELVRHVAIAAALKQAIEDEELDLVFQPIVSLADDEIFAFEALIRWDHPTLGRMEPTEFIALAEANGMIVSLGRLVLERTAEQASRWSTLPGLPTFGVGVNVAARELAEPDYASFVLATLARHDLMSGKVHVALELTERVFIDDRNPVVAANLTTLAEHGIRLVLDDFGRGYSALASLQRFPIASLKIDRLFTSAIETPADEAPVILAVIGLARALGLRVIAEGVETQVQLDYLRAVGADCGQGFLLGRPCSAEQTTDLLLRCGAKRGTGALLPAGACIRDRAREDSPPSPNRRPAILAPQISN